MAGGRLCRDSETPDQIATEVRAFLDAVHYRWEHTDDLSARQLGTGVHTELDRIHPFFDGDGRRTRQLADLVYSAEDGELAELYDWRPYKNRYIDLWREYDRHRDPTELAAFTATEPLD